MVLKNNKLFYIMSIFYLSSLQAKIVLPELLTKQSIDNIRFLSQDGKFTYYQKRSGSLIFSTNYKVQEVLKGDIGTQYTLFATPEKKKIVILQNLNYHNFYSLRAKEKIFLLNYGESLPKEIGLGSTPSLLLNDSWLSYYDLYSRTLNFENTTNSPLKFSIKLNNRINPYFIPQVLMSDDNTIYYTDLGENGFIGLLQYKRNSSKSELIYKADTAMVKVEICLLNNNLAMGIFSIHSANKGSSISLTQLPLTNLDKREIIYKSESNDLGHMVCNFEKDKIIFIKNYGLASNPSYDIASLNSTTKELTQLSELNTITNIVNMDGILLTQDKGKIYVVKGDTDLKSIDSLKKRN